MKLSQNVLIGVAAFVLTIWWTDGRKPERGRPSASVIWERFPKFVLGFIAASLVFSFVSTGLVTETKGVLAGLRTCGSRLPSCRSAWRRGSRTATGGRPALAFIGGQAFNVIWTLILAYALFGGMFFAAPTFN